VNHKKSPSQKPLGPMPTEILDAVKRVYQAGVSEVHAPVIFGTNRQTFFKLLGDDGRGLYQSRVVSRVQKCFSPESLEELIQAHNNLVKAKAAYAAITSPTSQNNKSL